MRIPLCIAGIVCLATVGAQNIQNNPTSNHGNKFEQLGTILPTPNSYRTASGAPGSDYWQQRADYKITCRLDEPNLMLYGSETITYFNNSPDPLTYLWLQLDENEHDPTVNSVRFDESRMRGQMSQTELAALDRRSMLEGHGDKIEYVRDGAGKALKYTINQTMMRVDLPAVLKPGQTYVMQIGWHYKIPDRMSVGGRGGYEMFEKDGNAVFTMSQWFPRLCVYSDFQGWQNHQFTGRGEFALVFGNYDVSITVPADHVVGATGECSNYSQVLSPAMLARWNKAQTAKDVVEIATLEQAKAAEPKKASASKTWRYRANMVRDFAWTTSRKFIWDAMPITVEGKKVMCMSYYPKEAYNLWRRYSTKVVAHTIKTYSQFTFPYPYPVAISVEASSGMEYPMICFNNGRTADDGTYTEATKYAMIGVIIHEVGHNFFPMIVNSDERQWSWMDEGLNSFVQYLSQELWDNKYPSRRGAAYLITDYMRLPPNQLEPIMSNSDNIVQFGPNAYHKPATALNILRETIMGRSLFDYAFKEYSRRWAFKHPEPADFFRTMEDASAVDLDWFWRGWFYGIDAVDISLDSVTVFKLDPNRQLRQMPVRMDTIQIAKPMMLTFDDVSKQRNRADTSIVFTTDADTTLRDFYWRYARGLARIDTVPVIRAAAPREPIDEADFNAASAKWYYQLKFTNRGGLVMPIILEWTYTDGTKETETIAVEIWRKDEKEVTKVFVKTKAVASVQLDPMRETADINEANNSWPKMDGAPTRFQLYKSTGPRRGADAGIANPMQREKKN